MCGCTARQATEAVDHPRVLPSRSFLDPACKWRRAYHTPVACRRIGSHRCLHLSNPPSESGPFSKIKRRIELNHLFRLRGRARRAALHTGLLGAALAIAAAPVAAFGTYYTAVWQGGSINLNHVTNSTVEAI